SGCRGSGKPNILIKRVRPGVLLEKARRRWLHSTLMAVDLPALERPTKQTSGAPGAGSWSRRAAEVRKEARCRRDTEGFGYGWFRALLYNPAFATVVPVRGAVCFVAWQAPGLREGSRRRPCGQGSCSRFVTAFQGVRAGMGAF